jgi:DNA mismatch repair protein MutH
VRDVTFDYRTASESEILSLALELPGLLLGDLPGSRFAATSGASGRHEAGLAIESFFGVPPNSSPEPDFPSAGIELKTVPLERRLIGLRTKERTVISMIDYFNLAEDREWGAASVRKKLNILFVFFEHLRGRPKASFPITHVLHWMPTGDVLQEIGKDWKTVFDKVMVGRAHELTESDGLILGPCTKSSGKRDTAQPFSDVPARRRAFALKQRFVLALFTESLHREPDDSTLVELATLSRLREAYRRYVGKTVDEVAAILGKQPNANKNYGANIARQAVLSVSAIDTREFKLVGPTIRSPRIGADLFPYEAISFPAFRHNELIDENWEDSALLADVENMLLAPRIGKSRATPQGDCRLGELLFWRPSEEQLAAIQKEWVMFRDLIAAKQASALPAASRTTAIHVRPHGRDSADRDMTPGGGDETKKSFWLNKEMVQRILTEAPTLSQRR